MQNITDMKIALVTYQILVVIRNQNVTTLIKSHQTPRPGTVAQIRSGLEVVNLQNLQCILYTCITIIA